MAKWRKYFYLTCKTTKAKLSLNAWNNGAFYLVTEKQPNSPFALHNQQYNNQTGNSLKEVSLTPQHSTKKKEEAASVAASSRTIRPRAVVDYPSS